MATSCTDFDHPYYKQLNGKNSKERINFFTGEKGKRMKFVSLGEALDFISYGGGNFVYYPLNPKEMTKYVRTWMGAQKPKIEWKRIPTGENSYISEIKSKEYFYLWNKFNDNYPIENREIPRINYEKCPNNNKHSEILEDRGGNIRCGNIQIERNFKEGFVTKGNLGQDIFSMAERYSFWDNEPHDPTPIEWIDEEGEEVDWSEEYNKYLVEKEKYHNAKDLEVKDQCYAIIKEPQNKYLPLQTILDRLNCRHSLYREDREKVMLLPFSGFTLANYVQAWWEQRGRKRVWRKKNESDFYEHFRDFTPYGTDD